MSEAMERDEPVPGGSRLTRRRALGLAALVLALVLAAGVAAGIVIERRVIGHHPRGGQLGHGPDGRGGPGGPPDRNAMRARLAKELGLDSAQSAKVDSIFERHRPAIDSVRAAMESRLTSVVEQTRREIDSVLTPAQREKMHARWEREDRRRGGPPRQGGRSH